MQSIFIFSKYCEDSTKMLANFLSRVFKHFFHSFSLLRNIQAQKDKKEISLRTFKWLVVQIQMTALREKTDQTTLQLAFDMYEERLITIQNEKSNNLLKCNYFSIQSLFISIHVDQRFSRAFILFLQNKKTSRISQNRFPFTVSMI